MTSLAAPFAAARISSRWGDRTYRNAAGKLISAFHCAVDYAAAAGTPVRAAGGGTVVEVSHSAVRGYMVAIDHGNGRGTRYHMLANAHRPRVGQRVSQGDEIGRVAGRSEWGSSSNGDHVHVEVRLNGAVRGEVTARANTPNPLNYFSGVAVAASNATPLEDDDMALSREVQAQLDRIEQRAQWAADYVAVGEANKRPDGQLALMVREGRDAARSALAVATETRDHAKRADQQSKWSADYVAVGEPGKRGDGQLAALVRRGVTAAESAAAGIGRPVTGGALTPAERTELETLRAERVARAAALRAEADRLDPKAAA